MTTSKKTNTNNKKKTPTGSVQAKKKPQSPNKKKSAPKTKQIEAPKQSDLNELPPQPESLNWGEFVLATKSETKTKKKFFESFLKHFGFRK